MRVARHSPQHASGTIGIELRERDVVLRQFN
jgi:hypothetical protein